MPQQGDVRDTESHGAIAAAEARGRAQAAEHMVRWFEKYATTPRDPAIEPAMRLLAETYRSEATMLEHATLENDHALQAALVVVATTMRIAVHKRVVTDLQDRARRTGQVDFQAVIDSIAMTDAFSVFDEPRVYEAMSKVRAR